MLMHFDESNINSVNMKNQTGQSEQPKVFVADDKSEVAELTAVNRLLVAGLFQALELRGIFSALCDPLILQGEKLVLIERYKQIEADIRRAITKSTDKEKR